MLVIEDIPCKGSSAPVPSSHKVLQISMISLTAQSFQVCKESALRDQRPNLFGVFDAEVFPTADLTK